MRLPRVGTWARDLEKELEWLPRLAPRLTLTVPEPVARGEATEEYPFTWAIYRWIDGTPYDGDERRARRRSSWRGSCTSCGHRRRRAPRGGRPPLASLDAMTREAIEARSA